MYEGMVREFHQKYGHLEGSLSELPPPEVVVLRLRLMMEELGELATAMHRKDLVEVADGIGDLIYVAVGTAISYGIPIDEVFKEVHRSNMTKTSPKADPASGNKYGGKTAKGTTFEPPQIRTLLGL